MSHHQFCSCAHTDKQIKLWGLCRCSLIFHEEEAAHTGKDDQQNLRDALSTKKIGGAGLLQQLERHGFVTLFYSSAIEWFNDVWWPGRHLHFLTTYIHMRRNNSSSWHSDSVVVLSNYYLLLACFKPKHQSKAKSYSRGESQLVAWLVTKGNPPPPPYVLTRNRVSWFARFESVAVGTSLTSLATKEKSHDFLIATTWDVLLFMSFFISSRY